MFGLGRQTIATTGLVVLSIGTALAGPAGADRAHAEGTMVYTQTNAAAGNEILAYRQVGGTLTQLGRYATGGLGSGDGLGSQGAVIVSEDHLLAVDAGSDQVSIFALDHGVPILTGVASSGGDRPISLTAHDNVVYALNVGDRTVSGFRIKHNALVPLARSTQPLAGSGSAQVSFDRTGRRLIVTEKATNSLDVLPVRGDRAQPGISVTSSGQTPFGFAVDHRNHLIVSNAAGGASGQSSLSSYRFADRTSLAVITDELGDTQTAACWVVLTRDGRYAYTTNTGSGTISSYAVAADGALTLVAAIAAATGAGPIDASIAHDRLFTVNSGADTLTADRIGADGSLTPAGGVALPDGVVGLATR